MDRQIQWVRSGLGLGLLAIASVTATGCKSTRPEVPPGRPYTADGRQKPAVGFSTEPRPLTTDPTATPTGIGRGSGLANRSEASPLGLPPGLQGNNFGAPSGATYGPPGTAGLNQPPALSDPAAAQTSGPAPGPAPATAPASPGLMPPPIEPR